MPMASPAVFQLLNEDDEDFAIDAAATQVGNAVEDLAGMESVSIWGMLSAAASSSGADVVVYIQSSFAGGAWFDIACLVFGATTVARACNVVASAAVPVDLTDAELADNTVLSGPLGDRLRAKVVSTGDFETPTVLALRAHAR